MLAVETKACLATSRIPIFFKPSLLFMRFVPFFVPLKEMQKIV